MISYEIENPNKPKPAFGVFTRHLQPVHRRTQIDPVGAAINKQRMQEQLSLAEGEKPPHRTPVWVPEAQQNKEAYSAGMTGDTALSMGKLGYARWLAAFVENQFPKGTMVTFRNESFVIGTVPRIWFKVVEIQQIHYMANMDKEVREPKAIGIAVQGVDIPTWTAPAKLRVLQPEEIKAIDLLRNQTENNDGFAAVTIDLNQSAGSSERNSDTSREGRQEEGDI
jgi:hypothetical protein